MASFSLALTLLVTTPVAPAPAPASAETAVSVDDLRALSYDDGRGHQLPYRLFVPRSYDPRNQPHKSYSLVMFLHGAGGRGTDNRRQLTDQTAPLVFAQAANQARWPVFLLAPQCPADQQWVAMPWGTPTGQGQQPAKPTWPLAAAIDLVDKVRRDYPEIDAGRVTLTGISMGGYGTWDAAIRAPTRWKAAVIVCGGHDPLAVAPLVQSHLPLWVFHAADDPTVPVQRSREMIAALRAHGAAPRYTEYPASLHLGHPSWVPAYADPGLLPWMLGPGDGEATSGKTPRP